MVTWELTIELILETFNLNQKVLADYLKIHPATLSKIKSGKKTPTFTPEGIFRDVFDPDTPNNPAKDTVKGLLNTLKQVIEQPQYHEIREAMDDCWNTADYRTFVETLIRRTICAPRSRLKKSNTPHSSNSKAQSDQLQNLFLMVVREYKVMDIINRKPPIMTRDDSVDLNNFLRCIDKILPAYKLCDTLLLASIKNFSDTLQIQALTLEATLNNRFAFEDENAFVNMEASGEDSAKNITVKNRRKLPEFSLELVESSKNRIHLLRIGISEWGNFRNEMNSLFERICTWNDKATE